MPESQLAPTSLSDARVRPSAITAGMPVIRRSLARKHSGAASARRRDITTGSARRSSRSAFYAEGRTSRSVDTAECGDYMVICTNLKIFQLNVRKRDVV